MNQNTEFQGYLLYIRATIEAPVTGDSLTALPPLLDTLPWLLNCPCPDVDHFLPLPNTPTRLLLPVCPSSFQAWTQAPTAPLSVFTQSESFSLWHSLLTSKEDEAKTSLVDSSHIPPLCPSVHSREAGRGLDTVPLHGISVGLQQFTHTLSPLL